MREGGIAFCGNPQVESRESQSLLVFNGSCRIRPGDSMSEIWDSAFPVVEALEKLGPEAMLAQYGLTARFNGETPLYDDAYYVLPSPLVGGAAKPILQATGASLESQPEGKYLEVFFVGPWEQVASAYSLLLESAAKMRVELEGPFYETSVFRLFDDDVIYACEISAAIAG